ncbi:MAG: glycosyltransferase [Actinobacteria bacterium]|nr:glycosyltransferase [Actinomycetota bacterium]
MADRTRVLWLIKGLGAGGAEQLLVNALPHIDRRRFEYHVAYILPWKNDNVRHFEAHDVPVHCLGGGSPWDIGVVLRLRRLLRALEIDVLDAHLAYSGVIGRVAARTAHTPAVIYTEHNLAVQRRLSSFQFLSFMANVATFGWSDMVVTVSRDGFRDVSRFCRGRAPVRLIYNGIPLDTFDRRRVEPDRSVFSVPDHHKVVGHMATFTTKKNQADLLRAAKLVLDENPDVTFVLVGKGHLQPYLEQLAHELGIGDRVMFPGFVTNPHEVLASFDIFALSSLYEGLPTVVIEAMASGVPVVATSVGGTAEIINHDHDGVLVPPGDPQALARGMLRLLGDDALRAEMGKRAEISARSKFDIRRRVQEVERAYDEVLGTKAAAR